jgi:Raf kinase inhibitor-like YbhB/YbcL family protein
VDIDIGKPMHDASDKSLTRKELVMNIISTAFQPGGAIPSKYSKNGKNVNPPLHIEDVPAKARSLALVVDDPDAPSGTFNHWVLFNMDPKIQDIHEDSTPVWATRGQNDFGQTQYDGPQPPSGTHHYHFKVFALDEMLNLQPGVRRADLEKAMRGHVIEEADLTAVYSSN